MEVGGNGIVGNIGKNRIKRLDTGGVMQRLFIDNGNVILCTVTEQVIVGDGYIGDALQHNGTATEVLDSIIGYGRRGMVLNPDAVQAVGGYVGIVQYVIFNSDRPGIGQINLYTMPERIIDVITENPDVIESIIGNTCSVGGSNLNPYKILAEGGIGDGDIATEILHTDPAGESEMRRNTYKKNR